MSRQGISPVGWYVVTLVERFECCDEDKSDPDRQCVIWENIILVKAKDAKAAYDKAMDFGNQQQDENITEYQGYKGRWIFEGISDLVPIYEEIGDLSEIMWVEHENVVVKNIKKWIYSKEKLFSLAEFSHSPH